MKIKGCFFRTYISMYTFFNNTDNIPLNPLKLFYSISKKTTVFPQCCTLSLPLQWPPPNLVMNIHPDAVFNTIIHDKCGPISFIMTSVSFEPEAVHIHTEEINQHIQDATSNYLVKIPTPNTNLLDTADDTIKHIHEFLQAHHSYPGPPTAPIGQFSSPSAQEHITHDLGSEAHTTTAINATESSPTTSIPTTMSTLDPERPP